MDQEQVQQEAQTNQVATIISLVDNAQFYRLIQNSRSKISVGTLKLAQFQETKTHFITIDKFCQNILPGTPFVFINSPTGLTLIFPHIDSGLNGIFIPASDTLIGFQTNLNQVVQMVPFDQAMQIQQFKDTIEVHCKDIATNPIENPNDLSSYIIKGGDALKKGFLLLGQAVASGINKGGEYINSKVDAGEEVQVNPETKTKYTNAKEKVATVFDVTGTFLGQLFKPVADKTKEVTNDLGTKIDNSDNNVLKQTKQLTSATWDAAGTALCGLGSALAQIGGSIGTSTRTIVQKKYGNDIAVTYLGADGQQVANPNLYQPLIEENIQQPTQPVQEQQQQQQQQPK